MYLIFGGKRGRIGGGIKFEVGVYKLRMGGECTGVDTKDGVHT
jgi:hypothetical protein